VAHGVVGLVEQGVGADEVVADREIVWVFLQRGLETFDGLPPEPAVVLGAAEAVWK
jgi:hypothetical protein